MTGREQLEQIIEQVFSAQDPTIPFGYYINSLNDDLVAAIEAVWFGAKP